MKDFNRAVPFVDLDVKKDASGLPRPSSRTVLEDRCQHRTFAAAVLSGVFFIFATCLYVVLAVADWQYFETAEHYTDDELKADDVSFWDAFYWETDVFLKGVWVSRIMMVYFSAAVCFVIVGVIDYFSKPYRILSLLLILAGLFGVMAAMLYDWDEHISNILNLVSIHLFSIEAIQLLYVYWTTPGDHVLSLVGSGLFLSGSLIDVVLSYTVVLETFDSQHAVVAIVSSTFWVESALINMYTVIASRDKYRKEKSMTSFEDELEDEENDPSYALSAQ